jgi:hypothetical protein
MKVGSLRQQIGLTFFIVSAIVSLLCDYIWAYHFAPYDAKFPTPWSVFELSKHKRRDRLHHHCSVRRAVNQRESIRISVAHGVGPCGCDMPRRVRAAAHIRVSTRHRSIQPVSWYTLYCATGGRLRFRCDPTTNTTAKRRG